MAGRDYTAARWLDRRAETAITPEDWPICSTMASVALDADWAQLDPDFSAGKKALGAEDWNGAIAALELAALATRLNADIQNYIGYAYRRLRQLGAAIGHYQQALMLNPRTAARMSISARPTWCLASPPRPSNCWWRWETSASFRARNTTISSGPSRRTKGWPRAESRSDVARELFVCKTPALR